MLASFLEKPTKDETDVYYSKVLETVSEKVKVRQHTGLGKGKALFAAKHIQKGEVILSEKPLISMQDADNKIDALVCSYCLKHAGSLEDQMYWYLLNHGMEDPLERQLLDQFELKQVVLPMFRSDDVRNEVVYGRCGAVYCCEDCKQAAYESYHRFLCTELSLQSGEVITDAEDLTAFEHFCEETNPSLYLAAQGICQILSQLLSSARQTESNDLTQHLKNAWEPYWHSWRPLWWDCVVPPEDVQDKEEFKATLEDLIVEASSLLSKALRAPSFCVLFDPKVMASLMGMIEQNNITIKLISPLEDYIDQLSNAEDSFVKELWQQFPALKEALLTAAQYVMEGSGYYPVACCANHSCCPNASHASEGDIPKDHTLVLVATRDIQVGEEITISYVDETMDYEQRTEQIKDYGFVCDCSKCKIHL